LGQSLDITPIIKINMNFENLIVGLHVLNTYIKFNANQMLFTE